MDCEKHGEYEGKTQVIAGVEFSTRCPKCDIEAQAADVKRKKDLENQQKVRVLKMRIKGASLSKKHIKYDLEGCEQRYPDKTKLFMGYLDKRATQGGNLLMLGSVGTGKTTLVTAGLLKWLENKCAIYTGMFKMSKDSHKEGVERYVDTPLLVIDEAGRKMGTDAENNRLFQILDERYSLELPTIFISNQSEEQFKEAVGEAAFDRIQQNLTRIGMGGESLRLL